MGDSSVRAVLYKAYQAQRKNGSLGVPFLYTPPKHLSPIPQGELFTRFIVW